MRSLNSRVFKWPDRPIVAEAVAAWAARERARHPGAIAIGYFGSYATDTWGVGSDVDLVAIVGEANEPFETRSLSWDTTGLPVPAQLLVYTEPEWRQFLARGDRFSRVLTSEVIWVAGSGPPVAATR